MTYSTDLNDRPFQAILSGTKKVEGRTLASWETLPLQKLQAGDSIIFTNNSSSEKLKVKVKFFHHYKNVFQMLSKEGAENVISSQPKTIEHGIEAYNAISEYKDSIIKNGIYAIGIELS